MDETTVETITKQQQLAELQAKVESLRTSLPDQGGIDVAASSPQILLVDSTAPIDLEKTPEFEIWKQVRLQGALNYLRTNWKMDVTIEQLVMKEMYVFPDPDNRKAYSSVDNYNYIDPTTDKVATNPATGKRMTYTIWRKIDPPAPAPVEVPAPTDTVE